MKALVWLHGTIDSRANSKLHSQLRDCAFRVHRVNILKMHPLLHLKAFATDFQGARAERLRK